MARRAASVFPSDAEIRAMLVRRIDVQAQGVGLVVGVIDRAGRRVIAHGEMEKGGGRPVDGDTLFEIGSTTKAFTALLLAEMAERREVGLDDRVDKYLPAGVTAPSRAGRQITLLDLATHTSGLPGMDPGFRTTDPEHPRLLAGQSQALADYTAERLYAFLSAWRLTHDIGARYLYSNLGLGLLGHVLARRAGIDFEALLAERITRPLGLADTVITPAERQRSRLASGHDWRLRPAADMRLQVLAGAGALRSTAHDLLEFLAAELGYVETPLRAAMDAQVTPRRPTRLSRMQIALGWHVTATASGEIISHSGATVGSLSFLGFDRQRGRGFVVLNNTREAGDENLGWRLLNPGGSGSARRSSQLSADVLERFAGRYGLWSGSILAVTREGDRLFAQLLLGERARSRPVRELFPLAPTRFGWADANMELTFVGDERASGIVLHSAGGDRRGARLAEDGV